MRRWLALPLLLLACRAPSLAPANGAWSVAPGALHFGAVALPSTPSLPLDVTNAQPIPLELTLTTTAPFAVVSALWVPAQSTQHVDVRLLPTRVGAVSSEVVLTAGEQTVRVPVDADVHAACATASACHGSSFDASSGSCVDTPLPDGTACTAACLDNASCLGGLCVGAAKLCSDGDACTVDSCDPQLGCRHDPLTCPTDANPCHVAACDPQQGCGFELAPDGTACGPADCLTANVCLAGACTPKPVPEGAACSSDSPCQPSGSCHNQQCVLPPPQTLQPLWTYAPDSGTLSFSGVTDDQGSLFWVESGADGGAELISVTADGLPRYRVGIESVPWVTMMLSGTSLVMVATGRPGDLNNGWVGAYRASDGQRLWSHGVYPDFLTAADLPTSDVAGALFEPWNLADDGFGHGILGANAIAAGGGKGNYFVLSFDLATGALNWKSQRSMAVQNGPVSDVAGNVYFTDGPMEPIPVVSLGGAGAFRWASTPGYDHDLMVTGRWLVTSDRLLGSADGLNFSVTTYSYASVSSPWALYRSIWTPNWYGVERREAGSGVLDWSNIDLGQNGPLEQTVLTDRDSVIGMSNVGNTSAELDEVLPDAGWGFRCPLPAVLSQSHWYDANSLSLRAQRLVVLEWQPARLSAFAVNRTLAQQGWVVSHGGTPGRQYRPR